MYHDQFAPLENQISMSLFYTDCCISISDLLVVYMNRYVWVGAIIVILNSKL
jgi:hypothetical protein